MPGGSTETAVSRRRGRWLFSLGIAIQNFPEGAIISMPLKAEGPSKSCLFLYGTLSGAVGANRRHPDHPAGGILVPVLPYALSFAAGAMVYVVVEELIPEMSVGKHSNMGTILFCSRFYPYDDAGCGAGLSQVAFEGGFQMSHLGVVEDTLFVPWRRAGSMPVSTVQIFCTIKRRWN